MLHSFIRMYATEEEMENAIFLKEEEEQAKREALYTSIDMLFEEKAKERRANGGMTKGEQMDEERRKDMFRYL